ncbi:hypothetical protein [Paenibacillus ginsengarvi]|uniref:Uncharacterized protein n=1 Tax=Paenibacillus ginsengarvi TaxID=400777 RepID=A0A3B0BRE8_9BACL|nr:hypothetical protein [Paenibacillus ginsengarvi]RKN75031.1 hypothetical protein D7M11_26210 [Paenibacillus ginsengarvi]
MGIEILSVSGGRVPMVDKEVEARNKANGPVVPGRMSPEELVELEQRLAQKAGPQVKPWEPTLNRDSYLQLRITGKNRKDITLSHFNNEENKLVKQLREWGLIDRNKEEEAMSQMKLDALTREEYLTRRAAGETRTKIMKLLGVNTNPFYAKLTEWGLKEKAAEDEALAALKPAPAADASPAELQQEGHASEEATAQIITEAELGLIAEKDAEIGRLREKIKIDEQELTNFKAAAAHWQEVAEQEKGGRAQDNEVAESYIDTVVGRNRQMDTEIAHLKGIVTELTETCETLGTELEVANRSLQKDYEDRRESEAMHYDAEQAATQIMLLEAENKRLQTEARIANDVAENLRSRVRVLEDERERNRGFVFLRLPILPGDHPIRQRIDLNAGIDRFATEIELSAMNRERAASELFQLVQIFVGFIHSEMEDLHPEQDDVFGFVKRYFAHHNARHLATLAGREQAG